MMLSHIRYALVLLALIPILLLSGCAGTTARPDYLAQKLEAESAYHAGQYARAADLYRSLADAIPQEPDYPFKLGNAEARQNRLDQAADAYLRTLTLFPQHAKAWFNLGLIRLYQARVALQQSQRYFGADQTQQKAVSTLITGIDALPPMQQHP
jgi:tetratricopeptide (TPR) repeat protein